MKGFTTISTGIPRPRWGKGIHWLLVWWWLLCNQNGFKRKRMNSQKQKSTFELLYNYVLLILSIWLILWNTSLLCTVSLLILLGFSITDIHQYQYPVSSPKTKHTKSSSKRFLRFMVSGFRHLKVHLMHHGWSATTSPQPWFELRSERFVQSLTEKGPSDIHEIHTYSLSSSNISYAYIDIFVKMLQVKMWFLLALSMNDWNKKFWWTEFGVVPASSCFCTVRYITGITMDILHVSDYTRYAII